MTALWEVKDATIRRALQELESAIADRETIDSARNALIDLNTAISKKITSSTYTYDDLQTDLNTGVTFIFEGIADFDTAFPSGIVIGSVVLNPDSTVNSGSGIAITTHGIVGVNLGVPTFTIDVNGNATFSGTLSGADGTFAGTLSGGNIAGTNGYFGTITAGHLQNADNSSFIELGATGASDWLRINTQNYYRADGTFSLASGALAYDGTTTTFNGVVDFTNTNISHGYAGTTTINGGVITTNTITASQITANTITANEIASNTITANEITAGTITANEIATGTITADKLTTNIALIDSSAKSTNYSWNAGAPIGFGMFSTGETDSGSLYNIVGGKIYGAQVDGIQLNIQDINIKDTAGTTVASSYYGTGAFTYDSGTYTMTMTTGIMTSGNAPFNLLANNGYVSISHNVLHSLVAPIQAGYTWICSTDSSSLAVRVYYGTGSTYRSLTLNSLTVDETVYGWTFKVVKDLTMSKDYHYYIKNNNTPEDVVTDTDGFVITLDSTGVMDTPMGTNTSVPFQWLVTNM